MCITLKAGSLIVHGGVHLLHNLCALICITSGPFTYMLPHDAMNGNVQNASSWWGPLTTCDGELYNIVTIHHWNKDGSFLIVHFAPETRLCMGTACCSRPCSQQLNTLCRITQVCTWMYWFRPCKGALHVWIDQHNIKGCLFTGSLIVHGWLHVCAALWSSIGFCNACNGHNESTII